MLGDSPKQFEYDITSRLDGAKYRESEKQFLDGWGARGWQLTNIRASGGYLFYTFMREKQ